MNRKKRFDESFRKNIAQIYLEGPRTALSLADEIGVDIKTIYKWARKYKAEIGNASETSETNLIKMNQRIHALEEEFEKLEIVLSYFTGKAEIGNASVTAETVLIRMNQRIQALEEEVEKSRMVLSYFTRKDNPNFFHNEEVHKK